MCRTHRVGTKGELACSKAKGAEVDDDPRLRSGFFLEAAAALVDTRLERQDKEAQASWDPDSFGIFDHIEYITGFGFVACQTYATAAMNRRQIDKRKALALGPKHGTGRSVAELINAGANHWKHSPEWSLGAPSNQTKQTLEVIQSLGVDTNRPYPLTSTLYEILNPLLARFVNLVPFLTRWRDAVLK